MTKAKIDSNQFRVKPGKFRLKKIVTNNTQGINKDHAKQMYKNNLQLLKGLQERLFAEGKQSLLFVLQAMDTAGKDSTIRKVVGDVNPQGCQVTGFGKPTDEELSHDFLWRIHDHAPPRGHIGIFNRSHYEDVLVVRVHNWASPDVIEQRYQHINAFEKLLTDGDTRIVKVMLHISKDYQLSRLRNRLVDPEKHWKFNPGDLKERALWDDYMAAYEAALNRCSTKHAPWYVIPAEERWFRDALVTQLLVETLQDMDPKFPEPDYDPKDYPPDSLT